MKEPFIIDILDNFIDLKIENHKMVFAKILNDSYDISNTSGINKYSDYFKELPGFSLK